MSATPRITVLLPVYNGEAFLRDAIESILCQTFTDFELLIINDGSSDGSVEIIASYNDPRLRVVHNGKNTGLIATLNNGLELAQGEFVARMDCDDISLPDRLALQVALLDAHPQMAMCGAWVRKFGAVAPKVCRYHATPALVTCGLLFDPTVAHPAVMMRRQTFLEHGLTYDGTFRHAEDYELWTRVARHFPIGNVQKVLLDYRIHQSQVSQTHNQEQLENAGKVRLMQLAGLGMPICAEDFAIHQKVSTCSVAGARSLFRKADDWLCQILEANRHIRCYPEKELSLILAERLVTLLKKMVEQGVVPDRRIFRSRLLKNSGVGWRGVTQFMLQSLRGNDHA